MFIHYYRYKTKYLSETIAADERLEIVYPTDEHSMITVGHDFYVIGAFHGIEVSDKAKLTVELKPLKDADSGEESLDDGSRAEVVTGKGNRTSDALRKNVQAGEAIRTVWTDKKDYRDGIYTGYAGIETEDSEEVLRSCGMPDLVYDPEAPESFWYTWNKAYYTDQVFSALIYGGTCRMDGICRQDQFGKTLQPLEEGYYELRVTLDNDGEKISSAKTVWITEGQKEIILSRFSPDIHVERVRQFVEQEGFEPYTDPYAGIWDTQYFKCPWPVKAWVEIPDRWHFGDAQEYESGTVHFFNYNISEACVSWKTEIGTMLAREKSCVDEPERLLTYYYENGNPGQETEAVPAGQLAVMEKGKYFCLTGKRLSKDGLEKVLEIDAICKPLPADTIPVSGCAYEIKNRLESFDYYFYLDDAKEPFWESRGHETGIISKKQEGPDEFLVLHVHHTVRLAAGETAGFADKNHSHGKIFVMIKARDSYGKVWEEQMHEVV